MDDRIGPGGAPLTEEEEGKLYTFDITGPRVLRELAAIGFADILDYAEIVREGDGVELRIRPTEEIPRRARSAVAGIKQGTRGVEIKLADKLSALEKLGRHLGLFEKRPETEDPDLDRIRTELFGEWGWDET